MTKRNRYYSSMPGSFGGFLTHGCVTEHGTYLNRWPKEGFREFHDDYDNEDRAASPTGPLIGALLSLVALLGIKMSDIEPSPAKKDLTSMAQQTITVRENPGRASGFIIEKPYRGDERPLE